VKEYCNIGLLLSRFWTKINRLVFIRGLRAVTPESRCMRVGLKQCTKYDVVTLTVLYRYLYITAIFQTVLTQMVNVHEQIYRI